MKAQELRQFSVQELTGRVQQWKDELFRNRIKTNSAEARDTSVLSKLRRDIARANTIISEKAAGIEVPASSKAAAKDVEPSETKAKKSRTAKGKGA